MTAHSLVGQGAGRTAGPSGGGRPVCGPGCGSGLPQEMLAVTGVHYRDFEGNGVLRLDPKTLQPLQRHPLRLGDAVMTQVPSPDGAEVALGGVNMGEILFADRSLRHVSRMTLVPHWQRHNTVQVDVEAWPLPSRLLAVATLDMTPWWARKPSELFVVDPASHRILRRLPLHGTVDSAAVSVRDGTTALLVDHGRSSRVVVVTRQGSTWSRSLRGLDLRGGKSVRVDGTSYPPHRGAALATDGRNRVFVVATDRPLGEIRLRERELRYHKVVFPRTYFSYPRPGPPGSAGVALSFGASAGWLGHDQLAISSGDDLPVAHPGGAWIRYPTRDTEIVDTRGWRWTRAIQSDACLPDGTVILCQETANGRGPSIVAYDSRWHRLWANRSTHLGWEVTAGRLLAWPFSGSSTNELDPANGRVLRTIQPAVTGDYYAAQWPTLIALRPRR
jgi:hypothetical protein